MCVLPHQTSPQCKTGFSHTVFSVYNEEIKLSVFKVFFNFHFTIFFLHYI